ncbi:MAG: hypothetical protein AAF242_21430, partial [Bacteroidota bacterium]
SILKEIRHMKDYIQLQEARLEEKIKVQLDIDIDDQEQEIAPLLFLPFIENAFKYTSALKGTSHLLLIKLKLKDKNISFFCQNPYNSNTIAIADRQWQQSGIGIDNTKRRLELHYSGAHKLDIIEEKGIFKILLAIAI